MSQEEITEIVEDLNHERYGRVVARCATLRKRDLSWFNRQSLLLRCFAIATIRRKDYAEGIDAALKAITLLAEADVHFWESLGNAFRETGKPACAAECFRVAEATDPTQRQRLIQKAEECLVISTTPEDIAISRIFFRKDQAGQVPYQTIQAAQRELDAKLYTPRWRGDASTFLHILRGHSSFTPIIEGSGGGYFLMHAGRGCVIDPGHGFIRNFLLNNYGFGDIHAVVVTHAHDDHVMDLPAIGSVLFKAKLDHKVDLYMDETSQKAFRGHYLLASSGFCLQPTLRPGERERKIFCDGEKSLSMDVFRAQHQVAVKASVRSQTIKMANAIGIGFRLGFVGGENQYLLLPSDTGWNATLSAQYPTLRSRDVAVVHISSIKNERAWLHPGASEVDCLHPQHMSLMGVIRFIQHVRPRYVLLGEKGAELDLVWHSLADAISAAFQDDGVIVCAPDIGTKVTFDGKGVDIINGYTGKAFH